MIDWYFLIFLHNFLLTCLEGDILRAYESEDSNFFLYYRIFQIVKITFSMYSLLNTDFVQESNFEDSLSVIFHIRAIHPWCLYYIAYLAYTNMSSHS